MTRSAPDAALELLQARVTEMELRYMEQEQFVHTLSELVRVQDRRIDVLELRLQRIAEQGQSDAFSQED